MTDMPETKEDMMVDYMITFESLNPRIFDMKEQHEMMKDLQALAMKYKMVIKMLPQISSR